MSPASKPSLEFEEILHNHRTIENLKKNPYIAAQNIVKDFDLETYLIRAVDNLSLTIKEHEYIAIIGASGAGKTTLLHLLAGLDRPTEGDILLSHVAINPMDEEILTIFRIFTVGVIFQNYNLISSLTAIENIMFPMQLSGMEPLECKLRAEKLLAMIKLEERAEHLPFQLSAGEQQRIAIARALANDPPIILADEPTANLDQKNATFIGELFEKFRQEGKTIIMATHDEKLSKYANRILEMEDGQIIADKLIEEVTFEESYEPEDAHKDSSLEE